MFKIESLKVCCPFIHSHYDKNNGNNDNDNNNNNNFQAIGQEDYEVLL